jgi:hypothetical protein
MRSSGTWRNTGCTCAPTTRVSLRGGCCRWRRAGCANSAVHLPTATRRSRGQGSQALTTDRMSALKSLTCWTGCSATTTPNGLRPRRLCHTLISVSNILVGVCRTLAECLPQTLSVSVPRPSRQTGSATLVSAPCKLFIDT